MTRTIIAAPPSDGALFNGQLATVAIIFGLVVVGLIFLSRHYK